LVVVLHIYCIYLSISKNFIYSSAFITVFKVGISLRRSQ